MFPNGLRPYSCDRHKLRARCKWKTPGRRRCVNSMRDLFRKDIPDDYLSQVWQTMVQADHHQFYDADAIRAQPDR